MPGDLKNAAKHIIVSATFRKSDGPQEPGESSRNYLIEYHPEGIPSNGQKKHFQLTKPRISACKNFFEENAALLINPKKIIGVARRELSKNEKLNLHRRETKQELVQSLFSDTAKSPHFLLLK